MTSPGHERHESERSVPSEGDRLGVVAGDGSPTPEERLESLLAERRKELEEHAHRFEEAISSVERCSAAASPPIA